MEKFSWKKRILASAGVLGAGGVSILLSGFLPNPVFALKILLFFSSIGCGFFSTALLAGSGIEILIKNYQQNKEKLPFDKNYQLEKELEEYLEQQKNDEQEIQKEKEVIGISPEDERILQNKGTHLDDFEQEVLIGLNKEINKQDKSQSSKKKENSIIDEDDLEFNF